MATFETICQEVVLEHVPDRPGPVVEGAAPLDPEVLGHRDLDVLDVSRFQMGSRKVFANRKTTRFWTVPFPR